MIRNRSYDSELELGSTLGTREEVEGEGQTWTGAAPCPSIQKMDELAKPSIASYFRANRHLP